MKIFAGGGKKSYAFQHVYGIQAIGAEIFKRLCHGGRYIAASPRINANIKLLLLKKGIQNGILFNHFNIIIFPGRLFKQVTSKNSMICHIEICNQVAADKTF